MVINFLKPRDQFAGPNGVVFFILEDGDKAGAGIATGYGLDD
jgi:hypothetical protein